MDPLSSSLIALFLFVLGATIGSFLNVVIYRLPRGESIVHPGSHCPRCGRALTWMPPDLVPILSWIALRGRCRSCATRISGRYAAIELLTGLLFVAAGWSQQFAPVPELLHKLIFIGLAIPIIFIDQDHRIVPDELSAPLFLLGLVWNVVDGVLQHPWLVSVITLTPGADSRFELTLPTSLTFAAICGGVFWIIRWFGEIAFKKEAMGLGDINIVAAVGANIPLLAAFCSFGIAIAVGLAIGLPALAAQKMGRRGGAGSEMPFGPALMIGALVMLLFPQAMYHLVDLIRVPS